MFLVVIGALLGALFGGFPGLLIGAALGYAAGAVLRQSVIGGLRIVQSQLIESTFAVMGALCKADSVVTRDEIDAVERIFAMLRLQDEQRRAARAAFNRGKQSDFDLDAAVDQFARVSRRRAPLGHPPPVTVSPMRTRRSAYLRTPARQRSSAPIASSSARTIPTSLQLAACPRACVPWRRNVRAR
jgi:hypothetical protein